MNYRITPIQLGRFENFEKSLFTFSTDIGTKMECPIFVFLVEGNGKRILFDCGPVSPAEAPKKTHRKINEHLSLEEALVQAGTMPSEIDCVVLSHLHWDHSYNLELFPDVPIYVQGREMEYAINPLPSHYVSCNIHNGNGIPQWLCGIDSFRILKGDYHLDEGLDIITLPGHSPGLQGLVVDTSEGKYLLPSDQYPLLENYDKGIPSGIHTDLFTWQESHEKALRLHAKVLPAHDDYTLQRTSYGEI